jgi:hypothetical protein
VVLPEPSKNADALRKLVSESAPEVVLRALHVCVTPSSTAAERHAAVKTALASKLSVVRWLHFSPKLLAFG